MSTPAVVVDWETLKGGDPIPDLPAELIGTCTFSWMADITFGSVPYARHVSHIAWCNRDEGHDGQHVALAAYEVLAVCRVYGAVGT